MKRLQTQALVIHTTASNSGNTPEFIQNYFLRILGWDRGGYHTIYAQNGEKKPYYDWRNEWTNGILPNIPLGLHNYNTIHLSYIGGINNANPNEPVCNITPAQEKAMMEDIKSILQWYPQIKILGHNQINQKACPSFWVPDWLRAWGIAEVNISDTDPFGIKDWLKSSVIHPAHFYERRVHIAKICACCGQALPA